MKLKKRECPIEVAVEPDAWGWCDLTFVIEGKCRSYAVSGCVGDGIKGFIDCVCQLYYGDSSRCVEINRVIEHAHFVTEQDETGTAVNRRLPDGEEPKVAYHRVPTAVQCNLDEEGAGVFITMRREAEKDDESDFDVRISFREWGHVPEEQEVDETYIVRYSDLCYALGKSLTEAVRTLGFAGFSESVWLGEVSVRQLVFLKAAGLMDPEWALPDIPSDDSATSSFKDELELLQFEL